MNVHDFNMRHLAALSAVRSAGSISGAADSVHLTQPAISQAITKLEQQLGAALTTRRPNGMSPTTAGTMLADRVDAAVFLIGSRRATTAQIRAFLALAQHGSYAEAARAAGLAEASLHRAVADLSVALAARLLERRGRGLALTRKGHEVARNLGLAMVEVRAGLVEVAALGGREADRIVVGAMPLARARLLPEAITRFHATSPGTDIKVLEGSHLELLAPLRDGRVDLMIGALRDEVPGDLAQDALFRDTPMVIGRAGHPLGSTGTKNVAKLLSYPWLVPADGTPLRTLWRRMFEHLGAAPPHVAIECGSPMMVRQLLIASDHLSLLSRDQVALELEAGWLQAFGPAAGDLERIIGVTTRRDWRPTARQAQFVEMLRDASARQ